MFARATRWYVRGSARIWSGAVGVVDVCLVLVGVDAMFSVVVPTMAEICFNVSPCRPWKVWFYFLIFWIARIIVVAINVASSIGVSSGTFKCCG